MDNSLKSYIISELKNTWHVKYYKYIDNYIANLTDLQIKYWMAWSQGKMGIH